MQVFALLCPEGAWAEEGGRVLPSEVRAARLRLPVRPPNGDREPDAGARLAR